jgi:hypothetical protein
VELGYEKNYQVEAPGQFVDQFAEFAGERPVKERAYEVVRGELVFS